MKSANHLVERLNLWTDAEIATLVEMWGQGASASAIANCLPGRTRNAVIGRSCRMNLKARPSPIIRKSGGHGKGYDVMVCQWVEGHPKGADTVYCGKPKAKHSHAYCAEHHARCYKPIKLKEPGAPAREFVDWSVPRRIALVA